LYYAQSQREDPAESEAQINVGFLCIIEDVGAYCRHDMRQSFQLSSVSGDDSKLGNHISRDYAKGAIVSSSF